MRTGVAGAVAGAIVLHAAAAAAADPQALNTNIPVQTEDALVVRTGTFELQGYALYTRDDHNSAGRDLYQFSPTLKLGPARHVQLDLSLPYAAGNQSSANQGNLSADAIYQFTDPGPAIPALAVQGGSQFFNYGAGHKTTQYFLRGLLTQWLGADERAPRLHLNLDWTHVAEPSQTGRSDVLEFGIAYSMLVSDDTALVADVVHGAKTTKQQNETILDVGLRHVIGDEWALSGSVGAGLGQQSPAFRVLFAVQRDFALF